MVPVSVTALVVRLAQVLDEVAVIQVDAVAGMDGFAVACGGDIVEGDGAIGVNYQPGQPVGVELVVAGDGHTGQHGEVAGVLHVDAITGSDARRAIV